MGLLNDVNILTTANARSEFKLYSILPTTGNADMRFIRSGEALEIDQDGKLSSAGVNTGAQVLHNPTFEATGTAMGTGTGWKSQDGTATFFDGGARLTRVTSQARLRATLVGGSASVLKNFSYYVVTYTVLSSSTSTSVSVYAGGTKIDNTPSAVGTHTVSIRCGTTNLVFQLYNNTNNSDLVIDNVTVQEVLRENIVLLDHTDGCPSILNQPSSTNWSLHSQSFNESAYIKNNLTVVDNNVVGITGNVDASIVTATAGGSLHQSIQIFNSNSDHTMSFWAKKGTASDMKYKIVSEATGLDLVPETSYISELSSGDWYRVTVSFTPDSSSVHFISFYLLSDASVGTCNFFGFQVENRPHVTSYIQTQTFFVSRSGDNISKDTLSGEINSENGVLFFEAAALGDDGERYLTLNAGGYNDSIGIGFNSNDNIVAFIKQNNTFNHQFDIIDTTTDIKEYNKVAFCYEAGNHKLYVNGNLIGTSSDSFSFATNQLNKLSYADYPGTEFRAKIRSVQVYKKTLTDSELISLTTI